VQQLGSASVCNPDGSANSAGASPNSEAVGASAPGLVSGWRSVWIVAVLCCAAARVIVLARKGTPNPIVAPPKMLRIAARCVKATNSTSCKQTHTARTDVEGGRRPRRRQAELSVADH
jgi:hypothetical protein